MRHRGFRLPEKDQRRAELAVGDRTVRGERDGDLQLDPGIHQTALHRRSDPMYRWPSERSASSRSTSSSNCSARALSGTAEWLQPSMMLLTSTAAIPSPGIDGRRVDGQCLLITAYGRGTVRRGEWSRRQCASAQHQILACPFRCRHGLDASICLLDELHGQCPQQTSGNFIAGIGGGRPPTSNHSAHRWVPVSRSISCTFTLCQVRGSPDTALDEMACATVHTEDGMRHHDGPRQTRQIAGELLGDGIRQQKPSPGRR